MIGQTIGNYRVTAKLSEGGMGAVYRAEHALIGKAAAVKVLLPELSQRHEIVERFFNEAKATSAIRHPGIVEIFDFGYDATGQAYIVMEFLSGEPLAQRVRAHGRLPVQMAVSIIRGIASAVGAAHAKGIVHRDLKPDNVFLVPDPDMPGGERPKVLDFGIAKLADNTGGISSRTRTGAMMGTPTYMAPEQCRGAGSVDLRADIYALGCILYELLVGRPPFVAEGFGEVIAAHLTAPPPQLRSFDPSISLELEAVVMCCLGKHPDARYASMELLMNALDATGAVRRTGQMPWSQPTSITPMIGLGSDPPPPGSQPGVSSVPGMGMYPIQPTPVPTPTTLGGAASATPTAPPQPAPRRGSGTLIAIGAVVAVAAAAVAFVVMNGTADAPPTSAAKPTPEETAPDTVTVEIETTPADAEVRVDGHVVTERPLRLARGNKKYMIDVRAPGHVSKITHIKAEADSQLQIALAKEAVAPEPEVVVPPPEVAPEPANDTPKKPPKKPKRPPKKPPEDGGGSGPIETDL